MHGFRFGRITGLALALALCSALPVPAASGQPVLDPSGSTTGTSYTLIISGTSRAIDTPPSNASPFRVAADLLVFQSTGDDHFDADMGIDTDDDGVMDRQLHCDGIVGLGRVGAQCDEDDGGSDIKLTVVGKALLLKSGKIALREVTGSGFTEDDVLKLSIKGLQD